MDFATYHAQSLGAWVYIVEAWFYCFDVSAELLVDSVVGLGHCFVRIVDTAAADAGHPGPHTSTALSPAVKALAVAGHLGLEAILLGQFNVLRFSCESFILILHFESL